MVKMNSEYSVNNSETQSYIPQGDELNSLEVDIAKDIAKKALLLFVPVAIGVYFIDKFHSVAGLALATLLVVMNLFFAALIAKICSKLGPNAFLAGALFGFTTRLILVFVAALIIKQITYIDFATFLLAVAIGHLVLLMVEMKQISFSLSSPGVKSKSKMK